MGRFSRWQDWIQMVIGVAVLFSPFYMSETSNDTATWTVVILGLLLAAAGLYAAALDGVSNILLWAIVVVGVVLFFAPWLIGFTGLASLSWISWIAAVLAIAVAGTELFTTGRRPLPSV